MRRALVTVLWAASMMAGGCQAPEARGVVGNGSTPDGVTPAAVRSPAARDDRLEIRLEVNSDVFDDRMPMRMAVLHFRNIGRTPLRLYLPVAEASRSLISSLLFVPTQAPPLLVPEPQPRRDAVTERDFLLLEPGRTIDVSEPFSIDRLGPAGAGSVRRPGFEPGRVVKVWWTYESSNHRWKAAGAKPDDRTGEPFGGQEPPWLWTGQLRVEMSWRIPS